MSLNFDRQQAIIAANPTGAMSQLNFSKCQDVAAGGRLNFSKEFGAGIINANLEAQLYWESAHDGDLTALVLGQNKKALPGLLAQADQKGRFNPKAEYQPTRGMVWFANYDVPGISHSGDVQTSDDGDNSKPEETMKIKLAELDGEAAEAVIVGSTHVEPASSTPIPFGRLRDAFLLVVNMDTNEVLCKVDLSEDFYDFTSVEIGSFYKKAEDFMFKSIQEGVSKATIGLQDIAVKYGL